MFLYGVDWFNFVFCGYSVISRVFSRVFVVMMDFRRVFVCFRDFGEFWSFFVALFGFCSGIVIAFRELMWVWWLWWVLVGFCGFFVVYRVFSQFFWELVFVGLWIILVLSLPCCCKVCGRFYRVPR